jgi:hypothetical protein
MPRKTASSNTSRNLTGSVPTETPATVRAEAETRGRLAFEQATADPKPTPEPLSWLWKSLPKEGKES